VEISISTRHGDISESIQEKIEQKVQRLPRFYERTTAIEVTIDLKKPESPEVEILVSAEESDDFFASDTGNNILTAVDAVMQKLERQLRKHKEKLTDHRTKSQKSSES
jgi:putative sigma-54 modulation protein